MQDIAYRFLERCVFRSKKGDLIPVKPTAKMANEVVTALRARVRLTDRVEVPFWLDNTPLDPEYIIPCTNGLLNLPTGEFLSQTPTFFSVSSLEFAYDRDAPLPELWLKFLNEVWPDDQECIDTLQEMFGYLITPDMSQSKIFMFLGATRSGKGTINRVLKRLVGIENVIEPDLDSLAGSFGKQQLIGKRLAVFPDEQISGKIDKAPVVKTLKSISGEDGITLPRKHKEVWSGQLRTRI